MRLLSIVLLSLAGFCLYLAASGSVLGFALGRSNEEQAFAGLVIAIIVWIPFAVFLSLGLVCSRRGARSWRASITILAGALFTMLTWVTIGALLLSPVFTAALQPGHDYASDGRLALLVCPVLLLLIVPAALHLRSVWRNRRMDDWSVTRTSQ